jgi:hypothetical protein
MYHPIAGAAMRSLVSEWSAEILLRMHIALPNAHDAKFWLLFASL